MLMKNRAFGISLRKILEILIFLLNLKKKIALVSQLRWLALFLIDHEIISSFPVAWFDMYSLLDTRLVSLLLLLEEAAHLHHRRVWEEEKQKSRYVSTTIV